jgi:hypothetical protein
MSALGHSLQAHSAPVLTNVRYASDNDHSNHGSELTRSANNDIWANYQPRRALMVFGKTEGALERAYCVGKFIR